MLGASASKSDSFDIPSQNTIDLGIDLGRPLDHPTSFGVDPSSDVSLESLNGVGYVAAEARAITTETSSTSSVRNHRCKMGEPSMPFWCGLLTRVIKAGTDEFKSAPCTQAQVDER
eukprot:3971232-Heterocapsa_arctica.AAC.1